MRHELEDNANYKGLSDELTIVVPGTGEVISEKEYIKRFNDEWYFGSRVGKYSILTKKEHRQEAERNNNNNKRDALWYAIRHDLVHNGEAGELKDFMEEACDAWEWQDVYKMLGPDEARHVIYEQTKRDINNEVLDLDIVLSRFIVKIFKLKTLNERKRKQGKK